MRRSRTAVTLIETLAAIALVALVAPVLTRAWVVSLQAASQGRDLATASMLASNQLQELILEGSTTSDDGDFGEDYPNYSWSLEASTWDENDSMQQLDLTVTWTRRNEDEYTYTITTLVQTSEE